MIEQSNAQIDIQFKLGIFQIQRNPTMFQRINI